jgi:hypothetical protein
MYITSGETRKCPVEFQARITRLFGRNPYGDPNFKIVWGQSEFHRMGNIWTDRHGNERKGYRDVELCHGVPCWNIIRWKSAAQAFGTPDMFYAETYDQCTGMQMLGAYPWKGFYEVLQPLYHREFRDNKLIIHHMPLSHILIDFVIPLILKAQGVSMEEKRAAIAIAKAEQHRKDVEYTAEMIAENLPAYWGPVSFGRQGIKTSLLTRKMDAISKVWDRLSKNGQRPTFQRAKGFFRGQAPATH